MKSFWFSVCALALLIAVIICNGIYIQNVTSEMETALLALPACEMASKEAGALFTYFQAKEKLLSLSVPAADMREISNYLTKLCVSATLSDKEAFEQARALCLADVARIRELERFSFLHIL